MNENRRDFLKKSTLLGLAGVVSSLFPLVDLRAAQSATNIFSGGDGDNQLPPLPYAYDALEPFIDKETMKIHHTKHHQAYIDKLKTAPSSDFDWKMDLAESCRKVNSKTSSLVRNNLGGHYNHTLFWQLMKPGKQGDKNIPTGALGDAITKEFKSFEDFTKEFSEKASKHFGSGWCWLVSENKKLKIVTTANQDNPLMEVAENKGTPILALDVWEHAYYLKYQNKRADYISNWWNVVNWDKAAELYSHI